MLAVSATYTPALLQQLEALMTQPQRVLLSPDTTSLLGVRQFYSLVPGTPSSACVLRARPCLPAIPFSLLWQVSQTSPLVLSYCTDLRRRSVVVLSPALL